MNEETVLKAALSDGLMHTVLLSGPDKSRCSLLGHRIASCYLFGRDDPTVLVSCPDYTVMEPPHSVDSIRDMIALLGNRSFSEYSEERSSSSWDTSGRRCILISDAHTMNTSCQNALLKVLEEPPEHVLFILIGNEDGMLQTIRSRSSVIRLGIPSREDTSRTLIDEGVDRQIAALAAAWADGIEGDARFFATEPYISFRKEATAVFYEALYKGIPSYPRSAALLKTDIRISGSEADRDPEFKPQKAEAFNAPLMIGIWQALIRDALICKLYGTACISQNLRCPESVTHVSDIARDFTFSQLECIIEMLDFGIARLAGGSSPALTVDLMLTELPRKEKKFYD